MEGNQRQQISISALFAKYRDGDNVALRRLEPLVYEELRRLARAYMSRERRDHTLQVTGLVNEAVTRLVGKEAEYSDAHHFYATAARIMRHVLVDYAKARRSEKRGGQGLIKDFPLSNTDGSTDGGIDLIELDEALQKLEMHSELAAKAVELHYFGGLTIQETANVLGISTATVSREVRFAKAWLLRQLRADSELEAEEP
jgi:RNA polymerase sigma factor (TIGR02999 family)